MTVSPRPAGGANYAAFVFPTPTPNNSHNQSLNERTPMRPYLPTFFFGNLGCFAKNVVLNQFGWGLWYGLFLIQKKLTPGHETLGSS